jgi:hypothetical protein
MGRSAPTSRIFPPLVIAIAVVLMAIGKGQGEESVDLAELNNSIGRVCKFTEAEPINENAECNPGGSYTRACDQKYAAASQEWDECYQKTFACRRDVQEKNKIIYAYNAWVRKCKTAFQRGETLPTQSTPVRPLGRSSSGSEQTIEKSTPERAVPQDQAGPKITQEEWFRQYQEASDACNPAHFACISACAKSGNCNGCFAQKTQCSIEYYKVHHYHGY